MNLFFNIRLLCFGVLALFFAFPLFAQQSSASSGEPPSIPLFKEKVLPALKSLVRTMEQVTFKSEITTTFGQEYYEENVKNHPDMKEMNNAKANVEFMANKTGYFFQYLLYKNDGKLRSTTIFSYNGTQSLNFEKEAAYFTVRQGVARNSLDGGITGAENLFLLPYSFLIESSKTRDVLPIVILSDLTDEKAWGDFVNGIKEVKKAVWGKAERLAVYSERADGTKDWVYFQDAPPYFPVGFDRADGEKRFSYDMTVTEIAKTDGKQPFHYAAKVTFRRKSSAYIWWTTESSMLAVDTEKKVQDEVFDLDPGQAEIIFDVDTRTSIKVPK